MVLGNIFLVLVGFLFFLVVLVVGKVGGYFV